MSAATERRCVCGHADFNHIFDGGDSVCATPVCKCPCERFILWEAEFCDPFGKYHKVTNIARFVRANEGLFYPEDIQIYQCEADRIDGRKHTYAEMKLQKLVDLDLESWKGWTLISHPKPFKQ